MTVKDAFLESERIGNAIGFLRDMENEGGLIVEEIEGVRMVIDMFNSYNEYLMKKEIL